MNSADHSAEISDRAYRKVVNSWCMYDWANSAFATVMLAAVMPVFYVEVAGAGLKNATNVWAMTQSVSMLIIALAAPVLGAIADHCGARKSFLGAFAAVGLILTALVAFVGKGDWLMASAIYVFARIGFAGANVFYDSLLPHIARPGEIDQISARGYAFGYLGGGLLLALDVGIIASVGTQVGTRLSFVTVAVWWALFSIPLFRHVSEPHAQAAGGEKIAPVRAGFRRFRKTISEIRRYRQLFKFLIAFLFYNDGIGTVMVIAVAFAKETLGLPAETLVATILAVQFIGVPFAIGFGWLAKRVGTKRAILLGIGVYLLISFGPFVMSTKLHFWLLGFGVAIVQGGSQALSRSLFGAMSPKTQAAEFFGFYNISSKFAAILGPLTFALINYATGSARLGAISVTICFLLGGWLLTRVDVEEGKRVAQEEDEAAKDAE